MTISQELEQRSIMVTYSTGQPCEESNEMQLYNDQLQHTDSDLASVMQTNAHLEQINVAKTLYQYNALSNLGAYDDKILVDNTSSESQNPLKALPNDAFEGQMNIPGAPVQQFLAQQQISYQDRDLVTQLNQEHLVNFIQQDITEEHVEQDFCQGANVAVDLPKEKNILVASQKSARNQTSQPKVNSSALPNGSIQDNTNNNLGIMVQNRLIAPAHASPVVYAEAANAVISSSAVVVHRQIYNEEDVGNNNGIEDDDDSNEDNRRDVLKEHALTHGYESGV